MMTTLAVSYLGLAPLWRELMGARDVLFWLMLGGFIWVIGDLFQQYAAKYVGISRGIPLSNTNQLWGLLLARHRSARLRAAPLPPRDCPAVAEEKQLRPTPSIMRSEPR